jgi:SAM-dependent methyltransferase
MKETSKDFWNSRWETGQTGWDIGTTAPAFINYFSDFSQKNAAILIPGCGSGYEAEFLVSAGYTNITLIDIAPKAVERLNKKFENNHNIHIICGDFFEHQGQYDYLLEQTFFCAINPALRSDYVKKAHAILRPKGKIIAVLFDRSFEGGPPFSGSKQEYIELFMPYFKITSLETNQRSIPQRMGTEVFGIFEKK